MVSCVCLKNVHKMLSQDVAVVPYREYLGLTQSSFVLQTELDKINCVKRIKEQRTAFEKEISKCLVDVLWDEDQIRIQCTAKTGDICKRNLLRSLRKEIEEITQTFTEKILLKEFRFNEASQKKVLTALKPVDIADPSTVTIILEGNNILKVVCVEGYNESDLNCITDILQGFE